MRYEEKSSRDLTTTSQQGHPSIEKTKELILWEYWWPKMKKDIEAYICACEVCQRTKLSTQAKAALLHPNAIPSWPWTHISVDMVTGLPMCKGYDAILMIVDHFSKEIIPIACSTELSSEGWAKILCNEVYAKHRMPQVSSLTEAPCLSPSSWKTSMTCYRSRQTHPPPGTHRQMDKQNESIKRLKKYLQIFVNHLQDDWVEWLSLAAFAHNNCTHSTTGKKAPLRLTTAITPISSQEPNPGHLSEPPCLYHVRLSDAENTCWSQMIPRESHRPDESPIQQKEMPSDQIPSRRQGVAWQPT